jgi:hypothetical protein
MQFTYSEAVQTSLPFVGPGTLTENVNATEHEDDANPADNSDSISFNLMGPSTQALTSHLILQESNSAESSTFTPGQFVTYKFFITDRDSAGIANDVALNETLYNPYDSVISTGTWELGNVDPGDRFLVTYQAWFPTSTPDGWYISHSYLTGTDSSGKIWATDDIFSSSTVYSVTPGTIPPPTPSVIVDVPPPPPISIPPVKMNIIKLKPTDQTPSSSPQSLPLPPTSELPSSADLPLTASIGMAFSGAFSAIYHLFAGFFGH